MGTTDQAPRYREIERLGAGGMATVTLAEDTLLGREVALKRVYGTGDPHGSLRLKREALVGASLNHPNLVSVYDAETQDDGDVVIVMEYVEGETLSDVLRASGRMRPDEAVRILEGVAAALDAIHARGIVHRDVKPANILLGREGAVKLADLGVADVADRTRITSSGAVVGSFSYMAPEQLNGASPSPGMDVYALAAVAFEMLAGQKARPESNPLALAHAISTQPPPDLRDFSPQVPPAAAAVLQRGMSADPRDRPATPGELVGRLREALAPGSTQPRARRPRPAPPARARAVPPPSRARPVPPPSRPPRRRSTGMVPVLILLAALAIGVLIAVLLSSGGSSNSSGGKPKQHKSGSGTKTHSTGKSSSSAGSSANDAGTPASSTPTASTSPDDFELDAVDVNGNHARRLQRRRRRLPKSRIGRADTDQRRAVLLRGSGRSPVLGGLGACRPEPAKPARRVLGLPEADELGSLDHVPQGTDRRRLELGLGHGRAADHIGTDERHTAVRRHRSYCPKRSGVAGGRRLDQLLIARTGPKGHRRVPLTVQTVQTEKISFRHVMAAQ